LLQYKIVNVAEQYQIAGRRSAEIGASVEAGVREGRLAHGAVLPTVRHLAASLGVSPATVAGAYRRLRDRGVVTTGGRRGTRVASRPPLPGPASGPLPAGVRDLAGGNPDLTLLPPLGTALAGLDPTQRRYGEGADLPELLAVGRGWLEADGIPAEALAVVGGALDGVERALAAHLQPGDAVAVEDPGYPRVLDLLAAFGLPALPVPIDEFGLRADGLQRALAAGAAAVVVTPRAQNPTGAALNEARAAELRPILRAHPDVLVVEDDHAGPVAGTPAVTLCEPQRARWAVVRSVGKAFGPDLRLAVLSGAPATIARVTGRQLLGTGWVSHVLQALVATLAADAATGRLLEQAGTTYAARRRALLDALAARGIQATGRSGMNVWIPVTNEATVTALLLDAGWAVAPGERYRLRSAPAIRVTVAELSPADAERFAADLATCLAPARRTYAG
jgi:DNA-binding transcriptional MocR family regulator